MYNSQLSKIVVRIKKKIVIYDRMTDNKKIIELNPCRLRMYKYGIPNMSTYLGPKQITVQVQDQFQMKFIPPVSIGKI